jgi:hypothetical protein
MTIGQIAIALALIGGVQILAVVLYWQATREWATRMPHVYSLFAIGGCLSLFGAVCFAMAFLLGD